MHVGVDEIHTSRKEKEQFKYQYMGFEIPNKYLTKNKGKTYSVYRFNISQWTNDIKDIGQFMKKL